MWPAAPTVPHVPDTLWPGALVDGKYRVERLIGRGGMGEVYLAIHERLGRRVAIKVLGSAGLREPHAYARFQREAWAASRLPGPHTTEVFDLGLLDNGIPFMVMEYLEGTDLSTYARERGPLPAPEVLGILLQLCVGLDVAHRAGVVHRDLKPANLFLVPQPAGPPLLKILDFGIAKATEPLVAGGGPASPARLTQLTVAGGMLGSQHYMAPEQMESAKDVDARADLWSVGVLGYRLLTGSFPFVGATLEDLFVAMVSNPPPSLATHRPDAPPALIVAIEGCLRSDRQARWPSASALHAILATAAPHPATPPLPMSSPSTSVPPHALVPAAPTSQGTYAFPSEPTAFGVPAYVLHPVDAPLAPPPVTYQPSAAAERNRGIAIGALALLVFLLVMTAGSCVGFMAWAERQPRIPNAGRQVPAGGNDRVR